MGQRVEVYGTSRHDMNGKRGLATDFHAIGGFNDRSHDRYTVLLDTGETFKIRPANVMAERAEEQAGAVSGGVRPPKGKGKGKKGRGKGGR